MLPTFVFDVVCIAFLLLLYTVYAVLKFPEWSKAVIVESCPPLSGVIHIIIYYQHEKAYENLLADWQQDRVTKRK